MRSRVYQLRLTDDEWDRWHAGAGRRGQAFAALIRDGVEAILGARPSKRLATAKAVPGIKVAAELPPPPSFDCPCGNTHKVCKRCGPIHQPASVDNCRRCRFRL